MIYDRINPNNSELNPLFSWFPFWQSGRVMWKFTGGDPDYGEFATCNPFLLGTLWLFNIPIENDTFIVYLPIEDGDVHPRCSMYGILTY